MNAIAKPRIIEHKMNAEELDELSESIVAISRNRQGNMYVDTDRQATAIIGNMIAAQFASALSAAQASIEALEAGLRKIAAIEDSYSGTYWQEIEEARQIAVSLLNPQDPAK